MDGLEVMSAELNYHWLSAKKACNLPHPDHGGLPGITSIIEVIAPTFTAEVNDALSMDIRELRREWFDDQRRQCEGMKR